MPGKINLSALPVGSNVLDRDNDEWTKVVNGRWKHVISHGDADTSAELGFYARSSAEMDEFAPFTMVQPDLFQQARIALRDRLGTEPSDELIEGTTRLMRAGNMDATDASRAAVEAQSLFTAPEPVADTFVLVVVHGSDAATRLVVSADTTAGLARLRAHAALDALLDQHGISR